MLHTFSEYRAAIHLTSFTMRDREKARELRKKFITSASIGCLDVVTSLFQQGVPIDSVGKQGWEARGAKNNNTRIFVRLIGPYFFLITQTIAARLPYCVRRPGDTRALCASSALAELR